MLKSQIPHFQKKTAFHFQDTQTHEEWQATCFFPRFAAHNQGSKLWHSCVDDNLDGKRPQHPEISDLGRSLPVTLRKSNIGNGKSMDFSGWWLNQPI